MSTARIKAYSYLLAAIAIWGVASPVIKYTLDGIEPFAFLAYRFGISAVVSLVFFLVKRPRISRPAYTIPVSMVYGATAFVIALSALFVGLENSTVLDLNIVTIIGPILVMLGGALFFRDRITHKEKLGAAIAFGGTILALFLPELSGDDGLRFTGNLLLFVYLLSDTAATLFAKKLERKRIPASILSNLGLLGAGIGFMLIGFATYGTGLVNIILELPLKYHLGVWYMATLSGSAAYYFYVRGYRTIEASEAALFTYLIPVFSVPLAVFWLGESITLPFVAGIVIVAIGVAIAELKKSKVKS